MTAWQSVILGIIEGLTEFLPISSTFHLIMVSRFLGIANSPFLELFEVVIQSGAILAVIWLYLRTFLGNLTLSFKVALAFIPTALVGLTFYPLIKTYFFRTEWLMLTVFVVIAFLFFGIEQLVSSGRLQLKRSLAELSYFQVCLIGLAQSSAVIPGVSRAGSVLLAMMMLGFKRADAAQFTFLLSVPTIISASVLDLYHSRTLLLSSPGSVTLLLLGFIISFLVAYWVVQWFLHYLSSHTLRLFAWYRLGLALTLILFLL